MNKLTITVEDPNPADKGLKCEMDLKGDSVAIAMALVQFMELNEDLQFIMFTAVYAFARKKRIDLSHMKSYLDPVMDQMNIFKPENQ